MSLSHQLFGILCVYFYVVSAEELTDHNVCLVARNLFAEMNAEFERCILQHVISHDFCEECLTLYVAQHRAYTVLSTTRDTSTTNANKLCGDEVNEADHFAIYPNHFARSQDIWNRARCTSELKTFEFDLNDNHCFVLFCRLF